MHAYLIMAHSNYNQLIKLLKCLDDRRNDIFLHLDSKFELDEGQFERIMNCVKNSKIIFVECQSVSWGGYSQIKCEVNLIKDVVNSGGDYTYVHLISGLDLPIKSQDYIHSYFDEHKGEEFVEFMNDSWINNNIRRFKYYYPSQDIAGKQGRTLKNILYIFQRCIVKIQQLVGINRLNKIGVELKGGSLWFSITYECAKYIWNKWPDYCKMFKYANCADEFLVQTIIASSVFYNNRHKAEVSDGHHENMRLIEWISGPHPKTYTIEDIDQLVSSDLLFSRKFDEEVDDKVIDQIIEIVTK